MVKKPAQAYVMAEAILRLGAGFLTIFLRKEAVNYGVFGLGG